MMLISAVLETTTKKFIDSDGLCDHIRNSAATLSKGTFNLFKSCLIVIIIYFTTLRGHFKPHSKQILKTKSHAFAILIAVHACT